ncbi:MAG: putative transport system permease protein [Thermoanaerobaculia bacterium]|jgi:putative ABC transport system permease protein|nr:putative transport system permease protein [Thermoanaerobaculia bacterium]
MKAIDIARFAWRSLTAYRSRTLLIVLAMSIGVGAVVVLTSLGEGARAYVRNQFNSLGANLVVVIPGRAETFGGSGGMMSGRTSRDLTLDDAFALRRIRGVKRVVPLNIVSGEATWNGHRRDVPVAGSTDEILHLWGLHMALGQFLPPQDPRRATSVCVIGWRVREELFGAHTALGELVRIGDRRFRVIGVLQQQGEFLGLDIDELTIIPVASAQAVFDLHSLLRVALEANTREDVPWVKDEVRRILRDRHEGEEDVTIITEDAVSTALDRILGALTMALGGIASISLAVAGILIMNVMLVAVSQRTSEIGLLKAIGASPQQIRAVFFAEAAMLSGAGGLAGSIIGQCGSWAIRLAYPNLPAFAPAWAAIAAMVLAIITGIAFCVLPARRAAQLDPAMALARR